MTQLPFSRVAVAALTLAMAACESGPPDPTLFHVPIEGAQGVDWYYGPLPNHANGVGEAEDYQCGVKAVQFRRTTDFLIPSFRAMEAGVNVLAAAPGQVVTVVDEHPDRNLAYELGRPGNLVRILHDDGIYSVYRHLKLGSVRVEEGDRVRTGDVMAEAGSSGDSEWPRLGFEAQDGNGDPFDPWAGACSGAVSLWASQPEYPDDFAVVDQGTTDLEATLAMIAARPPDVTAFSKGEELTFWIHTVNRPAGVMTLRLTAAGMPLESVVFEYAAPDPGNTVYGGQLQIAPDDPTGTWSLEYSMNGDVFAALQFHVADPDSGANLTGALEAAEGVGRAAGDAGRLRVSKRGLER